MTEAVGARPRSRTLGDLLDEIALAAPRAEAVVFRETRLDYAALKARADEFARALLAIGADQGDRVALLITNRPEWLVAAFGAAKIGAIVTAISTFSTSRELAWALEHSGAKVLVTLDAFRGRDFLTALREICPELGTSQPGALHCDRLPELRAVIGVGGTAPPGVFSWPAFLRLAASVDSTALATAQRAVSADDICYILYTSGSTATPKGVTLAHGKVIANGFDIGERMHLRAADRVWLAVPLFWSFGSANALPAAMTHAGCLVLQETFEPAEAVALIERERCTVYYGMANMARAMRDHPAHPKRRLGAMRTGLTIGPPEDIAMTIAALGAESLCNVYGSTETYGNCAVTDAGDPLPLRLNSQGRPLPGMTIRALDLETRRPLPAGEIGELAVGGYVTPGYYRAPELNAAAFDADGFFLTGDLGVIDLDGRVRFHGRLKEMIKTGGINVAPLEVEQMLLQHPDIVQAYVVGVPDAAKGEIVAAAVERRDGSAADVAAILAFCRERLASYKVPARLVLRAADDLPRTPTGKIHKPSLARELASLDRG
ncbi:MAG TPA: AMP-binding protein [Stellaceae bacterium]|nr:AMP-binding protein [Stellaceae bacterium]